jgi:ADP-dependent NAD(P)H-hydrate dehydratase / NAD(P)H-hydrate epimerase
MLYALTPAEMRTADRHAVTDLGIPPAILMENAVRSVLDVLRPLLAAHCAIRDIQRPNVLLLCGAGNNGGDGFALARHLWHSADVRVYRVGELDRMSSETTMNFNAAELHGIRIEYITTMQDIERLSWDADCVIDALVGVGGSSEPRDAVLMVLEWCASLFAKTPNQARMPLRIAVDIPTGLDAANGKAHQHTFKADHTITMAALKTGLLLNDAPDVCGRIHTVSIGIPQEYIAEQARVRVLTQDDVRRLLPVRTRRTTKHDFGSVAVIGGTLGMAGAPALTASAALSAGAGLVRLYTPRVHSAVAPEVMTHQLPNTNGALADNAETRSILEEAIRINTAFVIGPGLGATAETVSLVRWLLETIPAEKPIVLDADGLRAVSASTFAESGASLRLRANIVLTPNRGECARLMANASDGADYDSIPANAHLLTPEWASRLGCTLLIKNVPTVISDGNTTYYNTSGNAGMATAGSGDVLSGIIAALLAQLPLLGCTSLEVVALAAFLHGLAGDVYASRYSMESLTASSLVVSLRDVMKESKEMNVGREGQAL